MSKLNDFGFGTQIRKGPFFDATVRWGAKGFSVYNHMYIPRDFGDPEQNFWNLINDAILCDVAVERQVQIKGPDAGKFVQMMSPRDLSNMQVGQCKYVILTNQFGGILNDPVLLKVSEDCYWFSLADSDILFWAQGLAVNNSYDVAITEPDVSPIQLQGPKSKEIMLKIFGNEILDIKYYWFKKFNLNGIDLIISRTGWSSEFGYEIFLLNFEDGDVLYETLMQSGKGLGLHPGHTSTIRRIEGAMLSYHSDMDINTNPFELGMDKFIDLDKGFDFIGKNALLNIKKNGITRKQVGIILHNNPMEGPNTRHWDIKKEDKYIGKVTSAVYSPRLKQNIGLALVNINYSNIGSRFSVYMDSSPVEAEVVEKPFYDPNKLIAKNSSS
ncbi:MAG: glycine cleavage system protein T [Gammaproteobacteria bacterium]|nr:glycine cleavage system protein T [Gammaproteobacteria bacterium]|tara:strand:- start:88 stop:1239 length:1152 start_codon:yes stop_codon:yes gene_type:complete